ncbi:putative OTU-like cysteine protease [Rosellinia necatrix]|uniref:Putative OTU-like cysteine protease n=1 Tax=Rosellinia necatrix TaxID=77044 RepID=A0A1S8A6N3_ROSNE|nr:putative OTU-like cysteine protease [Rosellinia necatrix]
MEALETIQTRHRKEQRDLQARITNKKKNATKKSRKGINDECIMLERELKERQEQELAALNGESGGVIEQQAEDSGEPNGGGQNATENNAGDGNTPSTDTNGIAGRLRNTTISFDVPTTIRHSDSAAQAQTQSQGQGGKKRNRQKERMARRAAEQEAASEAAEQEVQGMTDHRALERSSLERAFSAHGLVEHEIRPDGHCLFSAVADQLAQRDIPISLPSSTGAADEETAGEDKAPPYKIVRRVATDYIERHADDFMPFLEEPLESYILKIRNTAEWGGQLELLALASAYQVEIKVVQNGRTEAIQPSGEHGREGVENGGDRTIWLAYYRHGYGLGEHYNSLRTKIG